MSALINKALRSRNIMLTFYGASIESVLRYGISSWFGNLTVIDDGPDQMSCSSKGTKHMWYHFVRMTFRSEKMYDSSFREVAKYHFRGII